MRCMLMLVVMLMASACGGDFVDCALGQLSGTWRATYNETDGTCGIIPSETVMLTPGKMFGACKGGGQVTPDKCRLDGSFTCPTADKTGQQAWTFVLKHVGPGRVEGTGTVQITDAPLPSCRSTYDIVFQQL